MKDKSLELLTEEERKFYIEFMRCHTIGEIDELEKRWNKSNESKENNEILYYDMTVEEFCKKYNLVSLEDIMERNGIKW